MKKIRYLVRMCPNKIGDIRLTPDITAKNLVATGVAEYVQEDEEEEAQQEPEKKEVEKKINKKHKKH